MPAPDLKIPDIPPRIQYVADGTRTEFAYPFPIFFPEDITVYINSAPQTSGYIVSGAGENGGGSVLFDTAPANLAIVTLERRMPLQRSSDFLQSSDFSAQSLNGEFDYLVAALQQTAQDIQSALRFNPSEVPSSGVLPDRAARAGKALAFTSDGSPTVAPIENVLGSPPFTAIGAGATERTLHDKAHETPSVTDFGAVGNGLVDDTLAIQRALAAHKSVFVPTGTYLITQPLDIGQNQRLFGAGQGSVIRALNNTFDIIRMVHSYASVDTLRLENGLAGIRLYGRDGVCVQNAVYDVTVWDADYGLVLDGYLSPDLPCYWNNFDRVLLVRPKVHGVWMLRSGAGDTPNANKFRAVRVYSLGAETSGHGFNIDSGRFNNAFIDCEANVNNTAQSCFRVGPDTEKNLLVNLYTESFGGVPNVRLDSGSVDTSIINLFSASDGPAIYDLSGRKYTAFNAGFPDKHLLDKTRVTDITAELLRFDTQFYEFPDTATLTVDLTTSVHLISSNNGAVTVQLPKAVDANGAHLTFKKTDQSSHPIILMETDGDGIEGRPLVLSHQYDYATVVSNGASWWLVGAHRPQRTTLFTHNTPGVFQPNLAHDTYLIDAFSGDILVQLPPADALQAVGRTVSVKRMDNNNHSVTLTEQGGSGPDGKPLLLTGQYDMATVYSNGAMWLSVNTRAIPENVQFIEGQATYTPAVTKRLHMISAFTGNTTVELPLASAAGVAGHVLTIKRVDSTTNTLTITEAGGSSGPDGVPLPLSAQGHALTVLSDGSRWRVLGRYG